MLKEIPIEENDEEINFNIDRYSLDKWRKHFGANCQKYKLAEVYFNKS